MDGIFTIGHSNHPIERFIALLKQHGIKTLADIRSRPASRFAPQFNRKALEASLVAAGLSYVYLGDVLGGRARSDSSVAVSMDYDVRRKQGEFQSGLDRLMSIAGGSPTAIMCAERAPEDCHRSFLVGRALVVERRVPVRHILADGSLRPQEESLL
jgi:uncharacterized protein (DUF488 family)